MNGHIVSMLLTLAGCFMLMCRVDKMVKGVTKWNVFFQHAILALSMFVSAVLNFTEFDDWSPAALAFGIVVFFSLSLNRWRHQAPQGTTKAADLDESNFVHVVGGSRE